MTQGLPVVTHVLSCEVSTCIVLPPETRKTERKESGSLGKFDSSPDSNAYLT